MGWWHSLKQFSLKCHGYDYYSFKCISKVEYIANAANISFLTAKDAKIILWHSKILDFQPVWCSFSVCQYNRPCYSGYEVGLRLCKTEKWWAGETCCRWPGLVGLARMAVPGQALFCPLLSMCTFTCNTKFGGRPGEFIPPTWKQNKIY